MEAGVRAEIETEFDQSGACVARFAALIRGPEKEVRGVRSLSREMTAVHD